MRLVNPLIERYVRYEQHNRRRAAKTVRLTRGILGDLVRFLTARFGLDPADEDVLLLPELADLLAWQESLGRMRDSSAATYTSKVRTFYRWAASGRSGRLLPVNPAEELLVPSAPAGLPRPISDEDLYRALDLAAATDQRMYCWLLLCAVCGLRCCEIAALHRRHIRIDERAGVVKILIANSKGKKSRVRDGGPGLIAALRPFLRSGPLFTSIERATGQPRQIPPENVSNYLNRFLRKSIGVPDTAHSLRHWFGTASYQARHDLRATQEAMGHTSPTTTAGYAAVADANGGNLGQDLDQILSSRGRIDARRAQLQPAAAAIEHARPEDYVLRMRLDGRDWPEIATTFDITEDDARRIARTAFTVGAAS